MRGLGSARGPLPAWSASFEYHRVKPLTVKLGDALPVANATKATPLMQPDARGIAGQDRGLQHPDLNPICRGDERGKELAPDPVPLSGRSHVDAHLGDSPI